MLQLGIVSSEALSPGSPDTGRKGGFHSGWQRLALVILQRVHQGHDGVGPRFSRSSMGAGLSRLQKSGHEIWRRLREREKQRTFTVDHL